MSDIIAPVTKPIENIGRGIGSVGGKIGDIVSDNPFWAAPPLWPVAFYSELSNQLFPEPKAPPGEPDEARVRRERARRLNAMQNSLASQDSMNLSQITSDDLSALNNPELSSAIAARRDTILTRRSMPGRAQTVLANEAQRY